MSDQAITVQLGNHTAREGHRDEVDPSTELVVLQSQAKLAGIDPGEDDAATLAARLSAIPIFTPLSGQRVTDVRFPKGTTIAEAFVTLTNRGGIWDYHSEGDIDEVKPAWVTSSSPGLQSLLTEHFECDAGEPDDLEDAYYTENGPPGVGPPDAPNDEAPTEGDAGWVALSLLLAPLAILGAIMAWLASLFPQLRVDAGKDFQSRVMGDTASNGTGSYAAANWIGLTENAGAPAAGDTTLTAELVVGTSAGLERAQAAYAHTAAASTYTLTKTFTLTGVTARTINKAAVFNASAAGTMVFETAMPSPPTLVTNDQLTVTETVTI